MSWLNHTDIAPHLQLVGYKRINLQVQKMIKVDFVITPDQMALWLDEKHGFKVLPGLYDRLYTDTVVSHRCRIHVRHPSRRWSNIARMLCKCFVFTGMSAFTLIMLKGQPS